MDVPRHPAESGESIWERYLTGKLTAQDECVLPSILEDLDAEIRDAADEHGEPPPDEEACQTVDIDAVLRELSAWPDEHDPGIE